MLRKTLEPINIAGRIHTDLDPDRVRVYPQNNRPLVGEYALYIAPYSDSFSLIGLINTSADVGELETSGKVALRSGWSVERYISGRRLLAGADKSFGYLIGAVTAYGARYLWRCGINGILSPPLAKRCLLVLILRYCPMIWHR
ncbi:FIG00905290: hypothetical protein [Brenneria goodwinii]|uniref:Uncharacterized protein n=1 Tax=Brenneria goodwinii TaxID=1109412 RepID=A0A0G4K3S0_9GAMM|nr:FIG00905290: hypothetical protein [Brenneria goodwinii]